MRIVHGSAPERDGGNRAVLKKRVDHSDEGLSGVLHGAAMYVGYALPSTSIGGENPSLSVCGGKWDIAHMSEDGRSPLQNLLASRISQLEHTRDYYDSLLRKSLETTGKPLWDVERGKVQKPSPRVLRAMEEALGYEPDYLVDFVHPRAPSTVKRLPAPEADQPKVHSADAGEIVEIIQLDLSLPMGPGATVDDYIEEEPISFDLGYVRGFTRTPPHRLRIARGVGDSMFPTLNSNDLVWIDSTQTNLNQQDRVWAVSINGAAAIKRLRSLKDGRVMVISDNPTIDNYEVGREEIRIGGRVIRFARDL
jgi:phage repressor protein C with HTH and peptisase S24 domain